MPRKPRKKPIKESDIIARIKGPVCDGCGAAKYRNKSDSKYQECVACGELYVTDDLRRRELQGGTYVRVQEFRRRRLSTGESIHLITFNMGPDDQLPDHDPAKGFYRPICVEQWLGDSLYSYEMYCGFCRHHWGSLSKHKFCPHCGAASANYVFADGTERFDHVMWGPGKNELPEIWDKRD